MLRIPYRPVLAGLALVLAAACGSAEQASDNPNQTSGVLVEGTDALRFEPDRLEMSAGRSSIVFRNTGANVHQLAISEVGGHGAHDLGDTGEVAGGETETLVVDLAPGEYEYACHVPGHYEAGMKGTIVVIG